MGFQNQTYRSQKQNKQNKKRNCKETIMKLNIRLTTKFGESFVIEEAVEVEDVEAPFRIWSLLENPTWDYYLVNVIN